MDVKRVVVKNIGHTDVIATMGQTDPAHVEIPTRGGESILRSGDEVTLSFDGGCAKLYIWGLNKNLIWCGIVPLVDDINAPLLVDSDSKRVTYTDFEIPECTEIAKPSRYREYFGTDPNDGIDFHKVFMGLLIVFIIYGVYTLICNLRG